MIEENEKCVNNMWMNDETHFHVYGCVSKQNFRGVIKILNSEEEQAANVNSDCFLKFLSKMLIRQLRQYGLNDETLFQQDRNSSHTADVSVDVLNYFFESSDIRVRSNPLVYPFTISICEIFFLFGT